MTSLAAAALCRWLDESGAQVLVMEATGGYERLCGRRPRRVGCNWHA